MVGIRCIEVNKTITQFSMQRQVDVMMYSCFCLFQSSSCLSDKEEGDLYDFAAKYEGSKGFNFGRYNLSGVGKSKLHPPG